MNISGIRPFTGFYENNIKAEIKAPELHKVQPEVKPIETGVIYESGKNRALEKALSEMNEDRVLQQYQFFAKSAPSPIDPSLSYSAVENFDI